MSHTMDTTVSAALDMLIVDEAPISLLHAPGASERIRPDTPTPPAESDTLGAATVP